MNHMQTKLADVIESSHLNAAQTLKVEHLVFFDCLKVAMMEKQTQTDGGQDQNDQMQFILQNNVMEDLMTRFGQYAEITLNNLETTMRDSSAILCEPEYVDDDDTDNEDHEVISEKEDKEAEEGQDKTIKSSGKRRHDEIETDSGSNENDSDNSSEHNDDAVDLDCECRYCHAVKNAAIDWMNFQPRTVMETVICENLKKFTA